MYAQSEQAYPKPVCGYAIQGKRGIPESHRCDYPFRHGAAQVIFRPSEAADIKSVIQEYGETPEQHSAVSAWLFDYAESRQPFDKIKFRENKMQESQCDNHLLLPNTLLTNLYALLSPVSGYVQSASFGIDMTMMAYL